MTTHSEIPIVELRCSELRVVSSTGGTTTVRTVPDGLQAAVRRTPEAMLGRRLIVCEGKTEVGLCRALDPLWAASRGNPPAHVGVVLVLGGGSSAPQTALDFASLGYSVALLADADVPMHPPEAEVADGGVSVFSWDDGLCTEERVMRDVPWNVLLAIIDRAASMVVEGEPNAVTDAIATALGEKPGTHASDWLASGRTGDQLRSAAGRTAKKSNWFKRTDLGEALGELIVSALPEIQDTDLAKKLNALADWAYAP
jgi:putative ATP-dependent endonuclease of OLD family